MTARIRRSPSGPDPPVKPATSATSPFTSTENPRISEDSNDS
jgi:hypothetical protein